MKRISKFYSSEKKIKRWLVSSIFLDFLSFAYEFQRRLKNTNSKKEYEKNEIKTKLDNVLSTCHFISL